MLHPKIGEIYLMKFSGNDNEQRGWRPGVVFQNDIGNINSPNIIALPLTSSLKKINMPTHVLLYSTSTGLVKDSIVLCENPQRMSKSNIGRYITTLTESDIARIAVGNLLASSGFAFIDKNTLLKVWETAKSLVNVV